MKPAFKTLPFALATLALLGAGNVSHDGIGEPTQKAGTMTVFDAAFGDPGEYNFSAGR